MFVNETQKMDNITINSGVSTCSKNHNVTMIRSAVIIVPSCAAHLIRVSASNCCGESHNSSSVQLDSSFGMSPFNLEVCDAQNTSQLIKCHYSNANKNTCKYHKS